MEIKPETDFKVGFCNCTGLLEAGKLATVIKHMKDRNISILLLTGTHMKTPILSGKKVTKLFTVQMLPQTQRVDMHKTSQGSHWW